MPSIEALFKLTDRVAIVTGASRGLGEEMAEGLAEAGAALMICARRDEWLTPTLERFTRLGFRVDGMVADVSRPPDVQAVVDKAIATYGRIDILVNNAGTHIRATVETTTPDILDRQLRDKVFGFFAMIQAVLPIMKRQRDGRIVNIVGQAARHPHPDRFPSGVTNAAVMAMTKSIADAVARDNIRVNAVCPQYIETELLASLIAREMRERNVDRATAAAGFTRANPLGRTGTPEEVADLVAFLVSDRSNFTTGSSVSIDGGYHRYVFG